MSHRRQVSSCCEPVTFSNAARRTLAPALLLVAVFACSGFAQDWVEVQRFEPTPPMPDTRSVHGIGADGSGTIAIGVLEHVPSAVGRVRMFQLVNGQYVEGQALEPGGDPANSSSFGTVFAFEDDWLMIGEPNDSDAGNSAGAVHAFQFDGSSWIRRQKILASDASDLSLFGESIALQSGRLFVGARGDASAGSYSGAAYVFDYDGTSWVERQKIIAPTPDAWDAFGLRLDASSDRLFIGAPGDDDVSDGAGAVYVYRFDGSIWAFEQKLLAPQASVFASFGIAVAYDGTRALVGLPGYDGEQVDQGAFYSFQFDGSAWVEDQRLTASDPTSSVEFGRNVALWDGLAVMGTRLSDVAAQDSGAAYVFRHDGSVWREEQRLLSSMAQPMSYFGSNVALDDALDGSLDGARVLVGAGYEQERGFVYAFENVACMAGTVDAAGGGPVDTLFVRDSAGGDDRTVVLDEGELLDITVAAPPAGGRGKFVLHANAGVPRVASEVVLPSSIGTACFEFRVALGASPSIVANSIGRPAAVGASMYFGTATPDPSRATTRILYPHLPVGTVLTLQALILDPGSASPRAASATNAVIVRVQ